MYYSPSSCPASVAFIDRQTAFPMTILYKLLSATGIFLIFHAAYSLQHYRSLIQDMEEAATGVSSDVIDSSIESLSIYRIPPLDVWLEMIISFALLLLSELMRTGSSLQPVSKKGGVCQKPMMAAPFVTRDFDIYASRGRGLVR